MRVIHARERGTMDNVNEENKMELSEEMEAAIRNQANGSAGEGFTPTNLITLKSVPVSAAVMNMRYRRTLRVRIPATIPGRPVSEVSVVLPSSTDLSLDTVFSGHVNIRAHIDAYTSYDPEMKRRYAVQDIVADEIEEAEPVLRKVFGKNVPGSVFEPTSLIGAFAGEVVRVYDHVGNSDTGWGRLTIEVPAVGENRRPSNFTLEYYKGRGSRLPEFNYSPRVRDENGRIIERGDFVYIYATVSSREKDGQHFENWTIQDIRKADDMV